MTRHVRLLSLVIVAAWCLSPAAAAGEASGSLTVGEDTVKPASAVAMWNESTAMWNTGAKILQVYLAPRRSAPRASPRPLIRTSRSGTGSKATT